jgi:hypothetical protein
MISFRAALAGGLLGTLVLTTVLRAATELRVTRMDLPFLLGSAFTDHRRRAKVIGYGLHLGMGELFAAGYAFVFAAVQGGGWVLGAILGVLHAVVAGTMLVSVLLPIVHPRMGTPETSANEVVLIEPPGFLMRNYGRNTFLITLVAHIAYGAIIGWASTRVNSGF